VTDRPTTATGAPTGQDRPADPFSTTEPDRDGGAAASKPPSPAGAPTPGERRLAHPPSDRYRAAEAAAVKPADPSASVGRGLAFATIAAIAGAAVTVVLGGIVTLTGGLIVVAIATGWAVGAGLRLGAGHHLVGGRPVRIAVAIALAAVALGQIGLWLYARTEGGVLPLPEYLLQVFGVLVLAQAVAAALAAWLTAR
jgi:hypothetical protein